MEELEGEIWKPIIYKGVDYTGSYEISNMGRVRSFILGLKPLKGYITKNGYTRVAIRINDKTIRCFVHSLVVSSFIRSKTDLEVIDHINSNKQDNRLLNLRIVTCRDNSSKEKTIKSKLPCGVCFNKHNKAFQSNIKINEIRIFLGYYKTIEAASYAYQLALAAHEKGFEIKKIFELVDRYRSIIGMKPINRKQTTLKPMLSR